MPWIERGAFSLSAVEAAVWKLRVFEEEATQGEIEQKLRTQKFTPLYGSMLKGLRQQSIVRTDPAMMQSALEIAMQRYPQWAAK